MCKYKDIFGKPATGIHRLRLFHMAFFDLLFSIIGAIIISKFIKLSLNPFINAIIILFLVFLSGIFLHRLFCVRTTIDKYLF